MSTPETLTRELAALDDALAGRPVDPDLADLAEFAALVRDERPVLDPAFASLARRAGGAGLPACREAADAGVLVAEVHACPRSASPRRWSSSS